MLRVEERMLKTATPPKTIRFLEMLCLFLFGFMFKGVNFSILTLPLLINSLSTSVSADNLG